MMSATLLHYQQYGKMNGKIPVVLLHGLLGELSNWQTQAKKLAQHHYVLSIDLRNHGHSPHMKGMSYRQMADDVQYLLAYLHIPKIQLLGHSMGGKVAMTLALHQPDLIQTLIVVDIAPKAYPLWHQAILNGMLSLPLAEFSSRNAIDQVFSEVVENAYERGFLLKNLQRRQDRESGYEWKCALAEIVRNYLKIADFPHSKQSYNGKVLFIKGEKSVYLQEEDRELLLHYFPHYSMTKIKQAGHLPHVEQADVFYELVKLGIKLD
jgi:esterase